MAIIIERIAAQEQILRANAEAYRRKMRDVWVEDLDADPEFEDWFQGSKLSLYESLVGQADELSDIAKFLKKEKEQ